MTLEEEQEFRQKVIETILPHAINMTEDQIRNIIQTVEKNNNDLPDGFGAMLFQQVIIYKYNKLNR
ncbi:MAG: hypothetical protein KA438_00650 [Aliarcobacter sp.]|jgi:hypothetical protein|nr:hypothetical protein [Aliarcobacter sp.]MBP6712600.1 hypothetical protein [Aliarcobacter sp.]MBP7226447.1 hypothetical protein [Aliarcobacter sp.]